MGLKKAKNYRGIQLTEAYYEVVEFRAVFKAAIEASEGVEASAETWRIIVKMVMYANLDKIEPLTSPKEYYIGDEPNRALITYNKVIALAQQHEEFSGAVEADV